MTQPIRVTEDPLDASPQRFKPILRLGSIAYRVTRVALGEYEIVRVADDRRLGTFRSFPSFEVTSFTIHPALVRQIARAAATGAPPRLTERIAFRWARRRIGSSARPGW